MNAYRLSMVCSSVRRLITGVLVSAGATLFAFEMVVHVEEPAGVERRGVPCAGGVPLPPGAVTDTSRLRLVNADGRPVPLQARPINRRPAGDVEWVHLAFLADVPASGRARYRLDDRGGATTLDRPLAVTDAVDAIILNTGVLQMGLPKDRFDGLGRVWLDLNGDGRFADDEEIVTGGGLTIFGMDGRTYRSSTDLTAPLAVSIEEHGPLFAIVRIEGTMKLQSADGGHHTYPTYDMDKRTFNPEGVRLPNRDGRIGFTARIQVWAGQPNVRAWVTLRNLNGWTLDWKERKIQFGVYFADSAQKEGNWLVDGVHFDLKLNPNGALRWRMGGGVEGDQVHEGDLAAAGGSATLYQDSSAGWMWQAGLGKVFDDRLARNIEYMKQLARQKAREKGEDPEAAAAAALPFYEYSSYVFEELLRRRDGGSFMGYRLYTGGTEPRVPSSFEQLGELAAEGMRAPGWIEVVDDRVSLLAGCRWFWQMFPKSLEVRRPGIVSIGLWSRYFARGHLFEGRAHKTHELVFDFRPRSARTPPAGGRFTAMTQRLLPRAEPLHYIQTGVAGPLMLPNPKDWPNFEKNALTAVVCGVDSEKNPAWDSSLEIEREKHDVFGIWKWGDSIKGGWHYFGQYQELDVPYCLMSHYFRTGDRRFLDEAELAVRFLLDVPAHGGGYGHQTGESSHYYVTGPLLYANTDGAPFLREAIRFGHLHTPLNVWHLRSFAVVMWANLAIYQGFEDLRDVARAEMDKALEWWRMNQNPDGSMGGMNRESQVFFLGMGGDAMGRYAEAFPDQKEWREALVRAMREWKAHLERQPPEVREKLQDKTCANAFAYAARFSGDRSLLQFVADHLVKDDQFTTHYRTGTSSAKNWSETMGAHRLIQTFMHDWDRERRPELYR